MVEIQTDESEPLKKALPHEENPTGKIKATINQWLDNNEDTEPAPKKSFIQAIMHY